MALDPEYTLAEEYIATIDGRVEDAHRRLAFAQTTGLDRDVMERVGEHLGRGDDQVGGSFWGDVWNVTKDVENPARRVIHDRDWFVVKRYLALWPCQFVVKRQATAALGKRGTARRRTRSRSSTARTRGETARG